MTKEEKKQKNNEFWKAPRGKAIIKLGLWFIFFIVIFIIFGGANTTTYNPNQDKVMAKFKVYDTMLEELVNSNYEYSYKYTNGDITCLYTGKMDNNVVTGIKETKDTTIKYLIENDAIYQTKLEEKIVYNDLYKGLNDIYLTPNKLMAYLNTINYHIEKEENDRAVTYDNGIIVKTNLNEITNIIINDNGLYELSFTNIQPKGMIQDEK